MIKNKCIIIRLFAKGLYRLSKYLYINLQDFNLHFTAIDFINIISETTELLGLHRLLNENCDSCSSAGAPNSAKFRGGVAEGHPRFDKGGVAINFYFLRV